MLIPSPGELGFPPKFDAWRPDQEEALRWLLRSRKRIKALSAPTGFGKTVVYIAYAIITGKPTCMITESRGLQSQLMDDFSGVGLVDLRGRRNYDCGLRSDYTCEEGFAARCPYKGTVACPASQAEMRAATSSLVVTNYDKWMASKKFGQGLAHISQVVFDEGHESPFALARGMQVQLHTTEVEETLGVKFPPASQADEFVNWKPWASEARVIADDAMLAAKARLHESNQPRAAWIKHYNHMRLLSKRLATIATAHADNWIVDTMDGGYQFDPVKVSLYAEHGLFFAVPSLLFVSATLRPKTLQILGVHPNVYDYREFPSSFDPRRCPIYYIPTLRVDSRTSDLSQLWIKHDQIAAPRQDRKGIVHTVSYARRDQVLGKSRFAARMLVNQRGEASTGMVTTFKRSGAGTILVSPAVGAGYDFPYQDAEWQFVCKIPFPQTTKIIKARQTSDPDYGYYVAMNKLVQICGRIMRAGDDQGETFFVDMHWEWFKRYLYLAPKWFRMFLKEVAVIPQPPPRLSGSVMHYTKERYGSTT